MRGATALGEREPCAGSSVADARGGGEGEPEEDRHELVEAERIVSSVDLTVWELAVVACALGVEPRAVPCKRHGAILDAEGEPVARVEREPEGERARELGLAIERERRWVGARLLAGRSAERTLLDADDRGVVAVLDPRQVTKRYGEYLRASLPPFWQTTDPTVVRAALRRLSAS